MSDSVVHDLLIRVRRDISLAAYDLYGDDAWEIVYVDNVALIEDRIDLTCAQIVRTLIQNDFRHNK